MISVIRLLLLSSVLLGVVSCTGQDSLPQETYVATVGDDHITLDEFATNYEFGYAHLRSGETPRLMYLNGMINERLLALHAKSLGYDTVSTIIERERRLREELTIDMVFHKDVIDPIEISDDQVNQAFLKSLVEFDFRSVSTTSLEEAIYTRNKIISEGFLGSYQLSSDEVDPFLLTNMSWTDIEPALLAQMESLSIGDISKPIAYRGSWYIIEIVDIRRRPYATDEMGEGFEKLRKQLQLTQAKDDVKVYVSSIMDPLDVKVRGSVFRSLLSTLPEIYDQTQLRGNLLDYINGLQINSNIHSLLDDTLVTKRDEVWTVADFFQKWAYTRYPLVTDDLTTLENSLSMSIALTIRDNELLRVAENKGYLLSKSDEREIELWKNKWMYREWVNDQIMPTTSNQLDIDRIGQLADSIAVFKTAYGVRINTAIIDSIDLVDSHVTVMVYKNSNGRMAYPILDPMWQ